MAVNEIERYFLPGLTCEVLGMRLVLDLKKGAELFPNRRKKPKVFVVEPGPIIALLGIPDIRPGDGLWKIGGDLAGHCEMFIDSLPTFVNALVEMHAPELPTQFSWLYGPKASFPLGAIRNSSFTVPENEFGALVQLRDRLATYARQRRLAWTVPRRHFSCGWYGAHTWLRRLQLLWIPYDKVPVRNLPVHEQYWLLLLRLLARHAPCTLNIRRNDAATVGFTSSTLPPQTLEQLTQTMNTRQLGSTSEFFKFISQWTLNEFNVKAKSYALELKPLMPEGIKVSLNPKKK